MDTTINADNGSHRIETIFLIKHPHVDHPIIALFHHRSYFPPSRTSTSNQSGLHENIGRKSLSSETETSRLVNISLWRKVSNASFPAMVAVTVADLSSGSALSSGNSHSMLPSCFPRLASSLNLVKRRLQRDSPIAFMLFSTFGHQFCLSHFTEICIAPLVQGSIHQSQFREFSEARLLDCSFFCVCVRQFPEISLPQPSTLFFNFILCLISQLASRTPMVVIVEPTPQINMPLRFLILAS